MLVADKRTLVVLASLIMGMTVISGLLLVLEPGPMAPLADVTLMSTEKDVSPEERLFNIPQSQDWTKIVIHDTGTQAGSAEELNAYDVGMGNGGLAYHFVVNNGTGREDGLVEIGFRWQKQMFGAYLRPETPEDVKGVEYLHKHGIGIILIGDADREGFTEKQMTELVSLVRQLQDRYKISAEDVFVDVGTSGVVGKFDRFWFKKQLRKFAAQ